MSSLHPISFLHYRQYLLVTVLMQKLQKWREIHVVESDIYIYIISGTIEHQELLYMYNNMYSHTWQLLQHKLLHNLVNRNFKPSCINSWHRVIPTFIFNSFAADCCMPSILLEVHSCINSFWHGVIPTSYLLYIGSTC